MSTAEPDGTPGGAVAPRRDRALGIYVHVPFCARVCPYCDFAVTATRRIPHEAYADALMEEIEARASDLEGRWVRTIYVGGGTPSRWAPEQLARLLGYLRAMPQVDGGRLEEVSIEANPMDVTPGRVGAWVEAGVERVSLGVQSFQGRVLEALGRDHGAAQARRAAELLLGAGLRVSIDLMFGAPQQTMAEWEADLDVFEQLVGSHGLDHLSTYNLTVEPNTPFERLRQRGQLQIPGPDPCAQMAERLAARGRQLGLEPYEASSWAVGQAHSRHNSLYWSGAEYLGVGVGAHSLRVDGRGVARRANMRHLRPYLRDPVGAGELELLSPRDHFLERVFIGMRTRRHGLDLTELTHQFGAALGGQALEALVDRAAPLQEAGLLERRGAWLRPTLRGLFVTDALGEALVPV